MVGVQHFANSVPTAIQNQRLANPNPKLAGNGNGKRARRSKKPAAKTYIASIQPRQPRPLPPQFVKLVQRLEKVLKMPVWLLIQNDDRSCCNSICVHIYKGFEQQRNVIKRDEPVALLIESSGGEADYAYRIARLFQRRTSKLTVLVPQYAKSAATLMALGASNLILGRDAELGPLDVQMLDPEREDFSSALDAVQSLERLNYFSLTAIDQLMILMAERTGKKLDTLMPLVFDYATNFVRPLLEKIDTVDYTRKSRELKVAEEYAVRLMQVAYSFKTAKQIASHLVGKYPTHGFVVDRQEARASTISGETYGLGLKIQPISKEIEAIFEEMLPFLDSLSVIGRLIEVKP